MQLSSVMRRLSAVFFALAGALFCQVAGPAPNSPNRATQWEEDLQLFAKQFPASHIDFAKLYAPAAFDGEIAALRASIASLTDAEITLRLMKLVASAHVAHTYVGAPRLQPFHRLPLSLAWFSDGLAVVGASSEYATAIGTHVIRIGSKTPEQLLSVVAPYVSYEADGGLRAGITDRLATLEILQLAGAAGADGRVDFTVAKPGGEPFTVTVSPGDPATWKIQGLYDTLHIPEPLFRKNVDRLYWYEYLADAKALYIQYGSCQNDPKQPFADFAREVFAFADSHPVERVIVDLRFNGGGNSSIMRPLTDGLKSRRSLRSKVVALIGPGTFSSAVLNGRELQTALHARLLGEPAGEKLNSYGEVRSFQLPNSHLRVQYSTKFFRLAANGDESVFQPDVTVGRTLADALASRDPVLEAALRR
jgi:hypothetical protein